MRFSCLHATAVRYFVMAGATFFFAQVSALADHEGHPLVPTASQVVTPSGIIDLSSEYSPLEQVIFRDLIDRVTRVIPPFPLVPGQERIIQNRSLEKLFGGFVQWPLPTDTAPFRIPPSGKTAAPPAITQDNVKPGHFIFAHDSCQPVSDRYGNFAFRALRGSLYAIEEINRFKLMRGRLFVVSSEIPVTVVTETGRAVFQPGSSGIVETSSSGATRVYALTGGGRIGQSVQFATTAGSDKSKEFMADLKPGQEAIFANHRLGKRQTAAVDGISRYSLKDAGKLPYNVKLNSFSLEEMVACDSLVNCKERNEAVSAASSALTRAWQELEKECESQDGFPDASGKLASLPKPDGNGAGVRTASTRGARSKATVYKPAVNKKGCFVLMDDDTLATLDSPDSLTLTSGTVLVRSLNSFSIKAGRRTVTVSKRACVLVSKSSTSLKVINLGDVRRRSVTVLASGGTMHLKPGREVIFTQKTPSLSHLFDVHQVGHKNTIARATSDDEWITTSDVSLHDSVKYHPLLSMLRKNAASRDEKKTVGHILKTAAALQHIYGPDAGYVRGVPQDAPGDTTRTASRCNNCLR